MLRRSTHDTNRPGTATVEMAIVTSAVIIPMILGL